MGGKREEVPSRRCRVAWSKSAVGSCVQSAIMASDSAVRFILPPLPSRAGFVSSTTDSQTKALSPAPGLAVAPAIHLPAAIQPTQESLGIVPETGRGYVEQSRKWHTPSLSCAIRWALWISSLSRWIATMSASVSADLVLACRWTG